MISVMYKALFVTTDGAFSQRVSKYVTNVNKDITIIPVSGESDIQSALDDNRNVDVIVCDHEPPKLDAIRVFNMRTRMGDLRPFIIVSPNIDASLAIKAFELRVDYYISKSSSSMNFYMDLASKIVLCAEHKHATTMQTINVKRLKALVQIGQMSDRPFKEVVEFVLKTTMELTNSVYGYISLYDNNTKRLRLIAYSQGPDEYHQNVVNCDKYYDLDAVGLWGEPVRQKRAIWTNDMTKLNLGDQHWPAELNIPVPGIELNRFVMIPVIHNGTVLATAGVAN